MDQERALTDSQRDEFEDMLRALTLERSQIREAMGFALDNAEAAGEVRRCFPVVVHSWKHVYVIIAHDRVVFKNSDTIHV